MARTAVSAKVVAAPKRVPLRLHCPVCRAELVDELRGDAVVSLALCPQCDGPLVVVNRVRGLYRFDKGGLRVLEMMEVFA